MATTLEKTLQELLGTAFELRRELDGGGMSRVFVAYEPALKREVVVKVLPPDLRSPRSLARFQQEIEVTAQLQHPHILPVVTAGGSNRLLYYILPYIAAGSLRDRLQADGKLPFDEGVRIAGELLAAVSFAHERRVVHRDIKPGNVLLSDGHAVLADFGIARAVEAIGELEPASGTTSVASPAAYRAPEDPRDEAADLYAVAVLTHEVLTGHLVESGESAEAIRSRLQASGARDAQAHAISRVLSRALSREPADRFAMAADFRRALLGAGGTTPLRRGPVYVAGAAVAVASLVLFMEAFETPAGEAARASVLPAGTPVQSAAVTPTAAAPGAATPIAEPPKPRVARVLAPFDSGMLAMRRYDTDAARRLFSAESGGTRRHARAQLQLALLDGFVWTPVSIDQATRAAVAALAMRDSLSAREVALAEGIAALGRREYVAACGHFERARAERADYDAWMGLGECRARDSLVVQDSAGALRFRASLHEASRAYVEAARLAPVPGPVFPYPRIGAVAFTEPARVRRGATADGRPMLGQPIAQGDSITFMVFPPGPRPRSPELTAANLRAITMARDLMRPVLLAWTQRDPKNVRAHEMLAELLEESGNIREAGPDGATALASVSTARALDVDSAAQLRLARLHARLLLRAGAWADAGRLADSVLTHHRGRSVNEAEFLVGLAMLTGRAGLARELLETLSASPARQVRLPDGSVLDVPPSGIRERASFMVSSALGICDAETRGAPARLAAVLDAVFPGGQRPRGTEAAFFERPLLLAIPCTGLEGARVIREPSHPIMRALLSANPDNRAQLAGTVAAMSRARQQAAAFEPTEGAIAEANVQLVVGDSAAARQTLARALDAVPVAPAIFMNNEVLAGTLVRSMVMRADLAVAAGEMGEARRWAAAAAALWAGSDEALRPVLDRMRALTQSADAP